MTHTDALFASQSQFILHDLMALLGQRAQPGMARTSWLNAVEGFFAKLTRRRLKRGVFKGMVDLQATINRFLQETNASPKPFVWTADPDAIIEKVRRGKQVLESITRRDALTGIRQREKTIHPFVVLFV